MTIHRYHPDQGEPKRVLYDNCERCAEHAAHPFDGLDDDNLRKLVALRQCIEVAGSVVGLSANEVTAIRHIGEAINRARRLAQVSA